MMLIDKKETIDVLMAEYRECSKDADEMGGEAVLLADGVDSAIDIVRRMPTIDPVKHGRWVQPEDIDVGEGAFRCSVCKSTFCLIDGTPEENNYRFCPACGAKMTDA